MGLGVFQLFCDCMLLNICYLYIYSYPGLVGFSLVFFHIGGETGESCGFSVSNKSYFKEHECKFFS